MPGHGDYTTKTVDCIKATGLTIDEAAVAATITVKVIVVQVPPMAPTANGQFLFFFKLSKFSFDVTLTNDRKVKKKQIYNL